LLLALDFDFWRPKSSRTSCSKALYVTLAQTTSTNVESIAPVLHSALSLREEEMDAMTEKIVANQFDLQGQGIRVEFSTSSISGPAKLSFTKGRKTLSFTGDQITQQDTAIGALVTVTIALTPDRSSTTFSVLLPAIQLAKETTKQPFRTLGITTIHKTTIAGPTLAVQETYNTVALRGTAARVQFLAGNTAKRAMKRQAG
jgi:hypothetical protein